MLSLRRVTMVLGRGTFRADLETILLSSSLVIFNYNIDNLPPDTVQIGENIPNECSAQYPYRKLYT